MRTTLPRERMSSSMPAKAGMAVLATRASAARAVEVRFMGCIPLWISLVMRRSLPEVPAPDIDSSQSQ